MIKQLIVIVLSSLCCALSDDSPIVCYDIGCVRGKNFDGNLRTFEGFLGIPFVHQPIDELRLRDPIPITQRFSEIYNATEEKPFCAQKNYLLPNPTVAGVEDCLYLYVYRPKNFRKNRKALPVIVYIHGGALFAGIAGPSISGADYFMDSEDVIFVTMSYRLGPLGFLSTGDENMSGNFGLKDQAIAIKWVKENIEAFGGDSKNIALMGQSAGALSVHLHMMSNWSRGNFHKVILLSGNGNAPYDYVIEDPLKQAIGFAVAAGINVTTDMSNEELADELRRVDAKKLIDATDAFKIWSIDPLTISRPVIEDCSKVNGFLCDNPVDMMRNGDYTHVPFLTGYMNGDGGVRALSYFENDDLLTQLNENFDKLFPKLLEIVDENSEEMTAHRLQKIKDKYLNGANKLRENQVQNLISIYTDRSFVAPMANTLLQLTINDRKTPSYLYKFSFHGSKSYSLFYTGTFKDFGPVHCDELIYLLKSPMLFPTEFEINSREADFRKRFVKFFTYFVNFGKPPKINNKTINRCAKNDLLSSGIERLRCSYVDFNDKFTVKFDGGIDNDAVNFWNEIDSTLVV